MNLGLEGRAALVTGGGSGIGAAVAASLAREGCDVTIVDLEPNGPIAAIESLGRRARPVQADVRNHACAAGVVREARESFGRLDLLVCSAGVTADAPVWKMTEAQWDDVLAVNLKGAWNYNHAVAGSFREQRGGRIVNIASINGLRGKFGQANYAASKAGMIGMSKSLARELGKYDVNVNVVAPGLVATPMTRDLPAEVIEAATRESAIGRLCTPEACAAVIVFLCSDPARHITGAVVHVDGGQYM
ncbi:MAG TPA: 3-oxoacyl-ACP reductase FabG [Candidatus Eisenbacteria bacterium]|nr:3-oxoacyl-ACP reductase FabG [Candidatus Eisenbacteria bacterium]